MVPNHKLKALRLRVQAPSSVDNIQDCQVLMFASSYALSAIGVIRFLDI